MEYVDWTSGLIQKVLLSSVVFLMLKLYFIHTKTSFCLDNTCPYIAVDIMSLQESRSPHEMNLGDCLLDPMDYVKVGYSKFGFPLLFLGIGGIILMSKWHLMQKVGF